MTIIIPNPILGTTATLTLINGEGPREVQATVNAPYTGSLMLTFPDPKPAAKAKAKTEPLYRKEFKGPNTRLPVGVRSKLEAMDEPQLLAFCKHAKITKPGRIKELLKHPARGLSTDFLTRILSGFDDAAPNTGTLTPLGELPL